MGVPTRDMPSGGGLARGVLTIAAAGLLALTQAAGAQGGSGRGDLARGQSLYETSCGGCHDRSVHGRAERSARTYEEIRSYVVRWQKEVGASWQPDEVDAVTAWLNDRHYRFPCPTTVCAAPRASAPR
jgi:mono/diheme cytochrome c family protein